MPGNPSKLHHARHWSRRLALQALYQWQMSGADVNEIQRQFAEEENFSRVERDYFTELLHRVPACVDELDAVMSPYLDRPINEVDPVERAILRSACYELTHRLDVPYKVVITEAVNLTKKFGATDSHKFINGVLDQVAADVREQETRRRQPG